MNRIYHAQMPEVKSEPFTITGIVASEPFYFVAGQMHRSFNLNFIRIKDFEFYDKTADSVFPCRTYIYFDTVNELLYLLFSNGAPIIKNLKTPDIILLIIGRDCAEKTEQTVKQLRTLPFVSHCKRYYYSEEPSQTEPEIAKQPQETAVQLNVFGEVQTGMYERVKRKRKKAVKQLVIEESVIDDLRDDLEFNLCGDSVAVCYN